MQRIALLTAAMLAILGLSACSDPATETTEQPQSIKVAVFPGGFNWALWVVKDQELDRRNGINIQVMPIRSSEEQMQGLEAGTYDLVMTGFDNVVAYGMPQAPEQPSSIVAFMGGDSGLLSLVGQPRLDSFEKLEGRKLGVDSDKTGYAFALFGMMEKNGLTKEDYEIVKAGGVKQRFEQLNEGKIDATLLVSPLDAIGEANGLSRIARVSEELGAYQGYSGAGRREWVEAHRGDVVSYIRAYRSGLRWLFNEDNLDAALELFTRNVEGSTLQQAEMSYAVLIAGPGGIDRNAAFDVEGARQVLSLRERFGDVPGEELGSVEDYYEASMYAEAE